MRKTLLQQYHELKESASASDFPNLLGNVMYKKLLTRFNGFPSPWKQYTLQGDVMDFKTHDRIILSEAPDLYEIESDGEYKDSKMSDAKYQLQLKTFGRTFSVGRQAIINDDLGGIMTFPMMFGRATVRTLVKRILTVLKGGPNAYDGKVLFHATHANYNADVALTNDITGMAAVAAAAQKLSLQTEPFSGELLGIKARYLLTSVALAPIAQQLIRSTMIIPATSAAAGGGTYNPIAYLEPLADPLIDSVIGATFWAVMADPQECPVIEVGFLNGKTEPDLLVQRAQMLSLAGGQEDQFGFEFDEIVYKVRHDWAIAAGYYQGICRGHS
jgi:hypothetical protein